ncbi:YolD-like family protein [Ornithinibacillus xuwenensis]|uniref:YolD-like family protein n=1 Tax=Ornithinibacillus xuwenensis TaxID=3144668 RepID=A0ABU9XEX0_9BACI
MVNDRGTIKWTSLMLPEHVELLKNIWKEDKKVRRPALDEQELEILNQFIIEAYQEKQTITINYYQDGQMHNTSGIIKKLDPLNHTILLNNLSVSADTISIRFTDIYTVI